MKVSESDENMDFQQISSKVFSQYGHVKTYCSEEKLREWKANKVPTEQRWVEIFQHMDINQIPYVDFARVAEFALCLPGANAITERVFSEVKNTWKVESSQLKIETIKSVLFVKLNLEYSCLEFHELLKKNEGMLKQIASQDKYDFKNKDTSDSCSVLDMSIDI